VKKFFAALGIIFLILIVLGAVGFAFIAMRGNALDKESKAYADSAISAIVTNWDVSALLVRASPEFLQASKNQDLGRGFRWFGSLGRLQKCDPPQGHAIMSATTVTGGRITARYSAKAIFEKGEATVTLDLIKRGDQWQIFNFAVFSPQLAPK
jgi:hypothetical protein